MLAVSTKWNYRPDRDIREMLAELKALGVNAIELGYHLKKEHVDQIIGLLEDLELEIASLHNFSPTPDDHPTDRHPSNHYRLTSLDEAERQLAVTWTKNTIDTAVRSNAQVVVIHAGTIDKGLDLCDQLKNLYKAGKKDTAEYDRLLDRILKLRRDTRKPYLEAAVASLQDVMRYAQSKHIKIGLETRYYPIEIPNHEEIRFFLDLFKKQGMYYWHDVGHAQATEKFGIKKHMDFLEEYKQELLGFHLHGMHVLRDHHAPFIGDMDLSQVLPYIKSHHLKVIESGPFASAEQMKAAVEMFADAL